MACQVGDGPGGVEEVTFLYRLSAGPCPKSYGVNVARLAGKALSSPFASSYPRDKNPISLMVYWFLK